MKNYNPVNANTLLVEILPFEEFNALREFCLSKTSPITVLHAVIGDVNFNLSVSLLTNFKHLENFWKLNFKNSSKNSIDGEMIFLEINETYELLEKYNFQKYRYYNKEMNSIISLNNDFYGNVKISYRAICANAIIADEVLTLHSSCLNIQGKNIALTGDSGAGKSTLFDLLDKTFDGTLIWEDFGFVNAKTLELTSPNEIYNQIKSRTLETMFPMFDKTENLNSEFYEENNPYYHERRVMVNFNDYRKTILNTEIKKPIILDALVILTNNLDLPYSLNKVSADMALEIFSKPIFSNAHQENVKYANGSLILDEQLNQLYNEKFGELFIVIKHLFILNNNYTPVNPQEILDMINEN